MRKDDAQGSILATTVDITDEVLDRIADRVVEKLLKCIKVDKYGVIVNVGRET